MTQYLYALMIPSDIRRCVGVPFRAQTVTSLSHRTSPRAHLTSAMHLAATPHGSGSDAMLSPLLEGSAGARRSGHSRKKPQNHIPRPPNVFILFLFLPYKKSTCRVSFEVETNRSTVPSLRSLALRGKIFPTKSAKFGMLEC